MPLTMLNIGETGEIKRIGGNEETRRFLNNLGFVDFKSTNSKFDFGNSSNIIAGDKSLMTGKILSDKKSRYTVGNADGAPVSYTHLTLPTIA